VETNAIVCKPKKTAKGGFSKAARKQRSEKGIAATYATVEAEVLQEPTITNSSGKYVASGSARKKKKKGSATTTEDGETIAILEDDDDGGEGEDAYVLDDDNADFFGDGHEDTSVKEAKSIKVALRQYLDEKFYGSETVKAMIADGSIGPLRSPEEALPDTPKIRKLFDTLQKKRIDLQKAARKEANAFVKSRFDLPCEDGVTTSHCMLVRITFHSSFLLITLSRAPWCGESLSRTSKTERPTQFAHPVAVRHCSGLT